MQLLTSNHQIPHMFTTSSQIPTQFNDRNDFREPDNAGQDHIISNSKLNSENVTRTHIEHSGNQHVHLHLNYMEAASHSSFSSVPGLKDDSSLTEDSSTTVSTNGGRESLSLSLLKNEGICSCSKGVLSGALNVGRYPARNAALKAALKNLVGLLQDEFNNSGSDDDDETSDSEHFLEVEAAGPVRLSAEANDKNSQTPSGREPGHSSRESNALGDCIQKMVSTHLSALNRHVALPNFPVDVQGSPQTAAPPSPRVDPSSESATPHMATAPNPWSTTPHTGLYHNTPYYPPYYPPYFYPMFSASLRPFGGVPLQYQFPEYNAPISIFSPDSECSHTVMPSSSASQTGAEMTSAHSLSKSPRSRKRRATWPAPSMRSGEAVLLDGHDADLRDAALI